MRALHLRVHLMQPFWHGSPDWPPSPFRLFQGLIAGAFGGRWALEETASKTAAFEWLESLDAPLIAAPPKASLRTVTSYVPNNDLDSVGGDPARIEDIRAEKSLSAVYLEGQATVSYAWLFQGDSAYAKEVCTIAERLHTFGRGVDPAWVEGGIEDAKQIEDSLLKTGRISRPHLTGREQWLPCPAAGSLRSLLRRHQATTERFVRASSRKTLFRQPPKPHFRPWSYDSRTARLSFAIRRKEDPTQFFPVPQRMLVSLVQQVRDAASMRLCDSSPDYVERVDRFLSGRTASGTDLSRRIQIIPLPTIGHSQASPSIRRVVVEIPGECPLSNADVAWAFAGVPVLLGSGGEGSHGLLVAESAVAMQTHYGFDRDAKIWRSVTPVALPSVVRRVRSGSERRDVEGEAAAAVGNALRHAGVTEKVAAIRIQQEPFHGKGAKAEDFADDRFGHRLRHVEITFERAVTGPLIVGDGRFLGLGLMRPVRIKTSGVSVFAISPALANASRIPVLTRQLRRAVMSRAQSVAGRGADLSKLFHGHAPDGSALRSGRHEHLFFAAFANQPGGVLNRLAILAPHTCDRTAESRDTPDLAEALKGLEILRCRADGLFQLRAVSTDGEDGHFGTGRVWRSETAYLPTRHPKRGDATRDLLERDVREECARRALPKPLRVNVDDFEVGVRDGIRAWVTLEFQNPITGPILIGADSHYGSGLFRRADSR